MHNGHKQRPAEKIFAMGIHLLYFDQSPGAQPPATWGYMRLNGIPVPPECCPPSDEKDILIIAMIYMFLGGVHH